MKKSLFCLFNYESLPPYQRPLSSTTLIQTKLANRMSRKIPFCPVKQEP